MASNDCPGCYPGLYIYNSGANTFNHLLYGNECIYEVYAVDAIETS